MERKFIPAVGEFYHVYNRGVEKREIFSDDRDRGQFTRLLYMSNSQSHFVSRELQHKSLNEIERNEPIVAIGAYCLMPNHFHLLIKELSEGGISLFMQKLMTAYAMHFNRRHKRVGPLFQGRYAISHINSDEYLKYLYSYIHLNPVKLIDSEWKTTGLKNLTATKQYLAEYHYSSLPDYMTKGEIKREESTILTPNEFPDYFARKKDLESHIHDWLNQRSKNP